MPLNDQQPWVLGEIPSHANMAFTMLGDEVTAGVRSLDYSAQDGWEHVYAGGSYPVGFGKLQYNASGTITVLTPLLQDLCDLAPQGRLALLPRFTLINTFVVEERTYVHQLQQIKFNNAPFSTAQGNTMTEHALEFICARIQYVI